MVPRNSRDAERRRPAVALRLTLTPPAPAAPPAIWIGALGAAALIAAGLAFVSLPVAVAAVVGPLLALVLFVRPEAGLYLLAFAIPFGSLAEVSAGGLAVDASQPILLLTAAGWVVRVARERSLGEARIRPGLLLLALAGWLGYLGVVALSTPDAPALSGGLKEVAKWLSFGIALLLTDRLIDRPRRANILLIVLLAAATAEALVGWAQFMFGIGPEGFQLGRFLRAYGTYGQPNPFAGYLNTILPLAYLLVLARLPVPWPDLRRTAPAGWGKMALDLGLALVPALIIAGAVGFSLSRGAWLALVAGILVVNFLHSPRLRAWSIGAALVGTLILLAGASNLLPGTLSNRILNAAENFAIFDARTVTLTPENWAIVERMATWQAAWEMFEDHPVLGVGAGNFNEVYDEYRLKDWPHPPGHAHNYYLNALAETGLVGLAVFLVFLATVGALLDRLLRSARPALDSTPDPPLLLPPRWIVLGVIGGVTALSVHNLLDNLFVHGMTIQLGLLLGLAGASVSPGVADNRNTA